ncbi:MAG: DUF3090 family protein [Acidimicrobiales bacterium]|nr:DUF3090 family protein [Acidimicrobiales bacterium]
MTDGQTEWNMVQPVHFTVGAVGEPGHREFYFQALDADSRVEVKCEKQQAVALAEHLTRLLVDLPEPPGGVLDPAAIEPAEALVPEDVDFVVGSISIGVDRNTDRIVVLFDELVLEPEDGTDLPSALSTRRLMVHLNREQVLGFVKEAERLASTGRPLCRLCNQPIDPSGHACPRLN